MSGGTKHAFTGALYELPYALVVIVPPLIGKLADTHGPLPFLVMGQISLALAALVQILFIPASPVWLVLLGLGLFGLGWGLQQGTATLAATMALPMASVGLAIGALYSLWNFGSSIGLAVAGMIFEVLDKRSLTAALAREGITPCSCHARIDGPRRRCS